MAVNLNECMDSEIEENWKIGCTSLIPEKSKETYQDAIVYKAYNEEKNEVQRSRHHGKMTYFSRLVLYSSYAILIFSISRYELDVTRYHVTNY